MPQIILNIEKQELGISAGLQDRVIQWYGGLVAMDFAASYGAFGGKYQPILPTLLPPLYLAYNTALGTVFLLLIVSNVPVLFCFYRRRFWESSFNC